MRMTLAEILVRYSRSKAAVLGYELFEELMQAVLKDFFDGSVHKARMCRTRHPLGRARRPVSLCDVVEMPAEGVVASSQRTRHLLPQDQEIRHQPGPEVLVVDPLIADEGRNRAQDRGPLVIV